MSRYITGQVNIIRALVDELTETIAEFCLKKELLETKGQYADCRVYIRKQCLQYREKLYQHIQKELKGFAVEQSAWVYQNSPIRLERVDTKKSVRNITFEAFSDTDTIKSYVTRLFNQLFQLWNSQLSIAYRTRLPMKEMVKNITGKEY